MTPEEVLKLASRQREIEVGVGLFRKAIEDAIKNPYTTQYFSFKVTRGDDDQDTVDVEVERTF